MIINIFKFIFENIHLCSQEKTTESHKTSYDKLRNCFNFYIIHATFSIKDKWCFA